MQYLLTFFEGIITFVSPCLLPMLPIYLGFFAGGEGDKHKKNGAILGAGGFVLGFTLIFTLMGALAGTMGSLLARYGIWLERIGGAIIVLFGLNYLGVLSIGFLNRVVSRDFGEQKPGFFASLVFGLAFAVGWTPCVGAFLGSALLLASQQGSMLSGVLLLLCYCAGLGIPFLVTSLLIDQLESTLRWIKAHYRAVNLVSGGLLVLMGILMMTGLMGRWVALLA